jgi:hypothetical protein
MKGVVLLDTMYVSVKYPKADVFDLVWQHVGNVDYRKLKAGVVLGDFVVRPGASGYSLSVWLGDARAFLTDLVDEKLGEGNGMGIWVQLGPKFLLGKESKVRDAVVWLLARIGVVGIWPMSVTRLDVAVDLFDVEMKSLEVERWRRGWVGRSKVSACHFNSRTGALETINVGARGSPVYLRVYDKVAQAIKEGDIVYWVSVWANESLSVTRVEWEVRPKEGGFADDVTDLEKFGYEGVSELLVYLLDWGRLCECAEMDVPRWRWTESDFWRGVRQVVEEWCKAGSMPIGRVGKQVSGVSEKYAKFVSGAISGGMARFDVEAPSLVKLLEGLDEFGEGLPVLQKRAEEKAAVYSRLAGGKNEQGRDHESVKGA